MQALRWMIVGLFALIPFATLVHRDDLGRWDFNRNAMAAPDEFSYLLLADNLQQGHGISTQATVGRDTFYPPGYPLLLALWWTVIGKGGTPAESVFRAHLLNALLLSLSAITTYVFSSRLLEKLSRTLHPRLRSDVTAASNGWIAVLITGIFVTNWHVLEGALYVFSEPAFMLTTFVWLLLALKWNDWPRHIHQTVALSLLAILAWSIRGAGVVCVATMGLYPLLTGIRIYRQNKNMQVLKGYATAVVIAVVLAATYQFIIAWASPEKALTGSAASDNSYVHQLTNGLTRGGTLSPVNPHQWPALGSRFADLLLSHLDDYAQSFTPWFRESPGYLFLNVIGKFFGAIGLLGFLYHLTKRSSPTFFLELYILLYGALYLVWPFDMARFWAPILPVMLVYGADALREFWQVPSGRAASYASAGLLALLLILSAEEVVLQLPNYERRLNYVSDSLAAAARTVMRISPDPQHTLIAVAGSDEHFLYTWYFRERPGYQIASPEPHLVEKGGRRETVEELLLRSLERLGHHPEDHLFILSYFTEPNYSEVWDGLEKTDAKALSPFKMRRIYQKEIIASVWEVVRRDDK
jgi:hypothetical protein